MLGWCRLAADTASARNRLTAPDWSRSEGHHLMATRRSRLRCRRDRPRPCHRAQSPPAIRSRRRLRETASANGEWQVVSRFLSSVLRLLSPYPPHPAQPSDPKHCRLCAEEKALRTEPWRVLPGRGVPHFKTRILSPISLSRASLPSSVPAKNSELGQDVFAPASRKHAAPLRWAGAGTRTYCRSHTTRNERQPSDPPELPPMTAHRWRISSSRQPDRPRHGDFLPEQRIIPVPQPVDGLCTAATVMPNSAAVSAYVLSPWWPPGTTEGARTVQPCRLRGTPFPAARAPGPEASKPTDARRACPGCAHPPAPVDTVPRRSEHQTRGAAGLRRVSERGHCSRWLARK